MKRQPIRAGRVLVAASVAGATLAFAAAVQAEVTLPSIIGDGMVVQREREVPIWGWARPGEAVTVKASWGGEAVRATADERGRWEVSLRTPAAGGPHELTIAGTNTIRIDDVLVGDVWLCSGQSNMEWSLEQSLNGEAEIAAAEHPRLRLFTVSNELSAHPRATCGGEWQACRPETARHFSAVGYFFGRRLLEELDLPIGLISADWGGTVAEAWMSETALAEFGAFSAELAFLREVRDPATRAGAEHRHREQWWSAIDQSGGLGRSWLDDSYDDSKWPVMSLPATLGPGGLDAFDGIVYFRRALDVAPAMAAGACVLDLGPIDDYDDVWVNGTHVGSTHEPDHWAEPRRYELPAGTLRAGRNVIAVRVLDTAGPGGINGESDQMSLRSSAGGTALPLAGEWRYARGPAIASLPAQPQGTGLHPNVPSVLFNGMIAPIVPFARRGTIWYQGESNRSRAAQYRTLFPALIQDWRSQWGDPDSPFYYVQIAPFRYRGDSGQTAELREAQLLAMATPSTGMVVTSDIGDPADIHPANKQEVGRRLALWALSRTYGRPGIEPCGPIYRDLSREGSALRLRFDHAEQGLELRDAPRSHFLIAGSDGRFSRAAATIDGQTLLVSSPRVREPVAVRYGWEAASEPNLFGRSGLPAAPFRSDDWSGPLPPPDNEEEVAAHRSSDPKLQAIFNGRDLSGWANVNCAPSTWRVENGMIVCSGFPTGVLRTEKQYENFVLELEFRHMQAGGNAGVFLWSDPLTARGQPFTRSIEVQVLDGQEGSWYTSDGDIFPIHGAAMTPENGRGGDRAFPTERRMNDSPLWNHYRIECRDGSVALAVNGKVVTRGRQCRPRRGYICLESEGSPIHFRNIRLEELPSSGRLGAGDSAEEDQGFVSLYSGVDFAGWKHGPEHEGHWTAADWRIAFDGKGPHLWTEKSYRNFVLICDWRWTAPPREVERPVFLPGGEEAKGPDGQPLIQKVQDAGDSGIYLRGSDKSQVNIWCWPAGSGEVYGYRTDPQMPPAVRAAVTPKEKADAPIGQWNRFVITMLGDRLTVVLNGRTVIENAQLPGVSAEGPIALQSHGDAIEFANVYLKELP